MEKNIIFIDVTGTTSLNPDVANWSFEQIKEVFEGRLDYISLAKQLGIEPKKQEKNKKAPDKSESNEGPSKSEK